MAAAKKNPVNVLADAPKKEEKAAVETAKKTAEVLEEKKTALGDLDTSKAFDLYAEYIIEELGRFPEKRTRLQDKIYFE